MGLRVEGLRFRIKGLGFRVQDSGFRGQGSGCRVMKKEFRVQGFETCPRTSPHCPAQSATTGRGHPLSISHCYLAKFHGLMYGGNTAL